MIKPNLISGKKKSSLKETYNRNTNGGHIKAQSPQGTPQRTSQQIPQQTPDLSRAEESDEHMYSEIMNLDQSMERIQEESSLDQTKTGKVFSFFIRIGP